MVAAPCLPSAMFLSRLDNAVSLFILLDKPTHLPRDREKRQTLRDQEDLGLQEQGKENQDEVPRAERAKERLKLEVDMLSEGGWVLGLAVVVGGGQQPRRWGCGVRAAGLRGPKEEALVPICAEGHWNGGLCRGSFVNRIGAICEWRPRSSFRN